MDTDREERKRPCRIIKEECGERGRLKNSWRERPGGIDMNVKEDDRKAELRSGTSALGKGNHREIPGQRHRMGRTHQLI